MQKVKLDLNDLRVESFETTLGAAGAEGTVFGQSGYTDTGEQCSFYGDCSGAGTACGGNSNHCGGTSSYCDTAITSCLHLCQD
jgi:hypothetical protein